MDDGSPGAMLDIEKQIIAAGIGWIASGISSGLLYAFLVRHAGFLVIAILASLSGIWVIIARDRIMRIRSAMISGRARYKSK